MSPPAGRRSVPATASERFAIAVLPGDGIGHEVVPASIEVLSATAELSNLDLEFRYYEAGADFYSRTGVAITPEVMTEIGEADAILLGAMGLPGIRYPDNTEIAPQIEIREHYDLFASVRPARMLPGVPPVLTGERGRTIDFVVIREITEGLFAGRTAPDIAEDRASNVLTITRGGAERVFDFAFELARQRKRQGFPGRVTLVDKANVLAAFAFMRRIFDERRALYPDIQADTAYIDAAAMWMILDPQRFDVVVTENQFGDILSEVAAGIVGGLGLAPSADIGASHAVFQPSHGTAPDIAGQGKANPIATILSAAMMLDWLGERRESRACRAAAAVIRKGVDQALLGGLRPYDLGGRHGTRDVTRAIIDALSRMASSETDA
ncbi:MAG TPA: isocitrate/isopropylmalate dehydrogenase family protein [Microvirga sp.]|nr:isocitrate/isopropylmalate dehydrogenase family protein [Microvirga sp.]